MGKLDQPHKRDVPVGDTSTDSSEGGLSEARQLAFSPGSDRKLSGRERISDGVGEKQFAEDFRRSQREYMGVESGRNTQTGDSNGKPMASSETLMRAEAHLVYSALHSHNLNLRGQAAGSLKGEQYDSNNEESVHQAFISSQRKHEHLPPTASATQIEDARIHRAYLDDKKKGTQIEFD